MSTSPVLESSTSPGSPPARAGGDLGEPAGATSPATEHRSARAHALLSIERSLSSLRILSAAAVILALWWGQVVLIPLVFSVVISYALEPLVARLEKWHIKRPLGVPLVLAAVLVGLVVGVFALRGQGAAFINRLPDAAHRLAQSIEHAARSGPGVVKKVQQAANELEQAASTAAHKTVSDGVTPVRVEEPTFKWSDWLWQGGFGAVELAAQMFAVLCLVYCLLAAGDLYKRKLVHIMPTLSRKKITVQVLDEIDRQVERFLIARLVISVVVGVVIGVVFGLLGLEEAGVWGVLAAVLFTIPFAGPAAVVLAAMGAAFVQFESVGMAAVVGGASVLIGVLEGYALTPWLMSRVGDMNPVAVFVSLLFWGWIWGLWGLLLAMPIMAAAKAACERIDGLTVFADLLSAPE